MTIPNPECPLLEADAQGAVSESQNAIAMAIPQ